jgi:hypothetical protein
MKNNVQIIGTINKELDEWEENLSGTQKIYET